MVRIAFSILFCAVPALADKTWVEFYDFSATGKLHVARQTELRRVTRPVAEMDASGNLLGDRYVMSGSRLDIGFRLEVENEAQLRVQGLYHELQSFALKEMLKRGYISPSLFEDVSYAMHIWQPAQIRFALDLMELTKTEALRRYNGEIPWDRVMGGQEFYSQHRRRRRPRSGKTPRAFEVRVDTSTGRVTVDGKGIPEEEETLTFVRASILIGLGQTVNMKTGDLEKLPLSWENYPRRHPLAFPPGSNPPHMAEFSRALAGDSVLGGSLPELIRLSLYWLEAEARLRDVPPEQYLIFAHGLDKAHARYFQQAFRMQPFTAEAQRTILENNGDVPPLSAMPPIDSGTAVTFTTLAEGVKRPGLSPRGISLTRSWRASVCGDHERADAFEREFYRGVFWHMGFPQEVQSTPVCIQDLSPVSLLPSLDEVHRWGVSGDYSKLFNRAGDMKWDPNFWAPYWNGGSFILPEIHTAEGTRPLGFVRMDNLSNAGEAYLREILIQTYAVQWLRITKANKESRQKVLDYLHHLERTLPPIPNAPTTPLGPDPQPHEILDRFVYVFFTDQPEVRNSAVKLGGKAFRGNAYTVPKIFVRVGKDGVKVVRTEMTGEGWGIVFRPRQILGFGPIRRTANCSKHLLDYFLLQAAAQM